MIRKSLWSKHAFMLMMLCLLKDVDGQTFGGRVTSPSGGTTRYGAPEGISPADITPEKVNMSHLIPLLDQFKTYIERGNLPKYRPRQNEGMSLGTYYLLSFVDDERFAAEIHTNYASPLFETYGKDEPEVVRLYYLTGGSVEKLRNLYTHSQNTEIKKAVESCLFEEGEVFQEVEERIKTPSDMNSPLSIKVSVKQAEVVGQAHESVPIKNVYDVFVEFENRSTGPVYFSFPWFDYSYRLEPAMFNLQRKDRGPVRHQSRPVKEQKVVLNPGDRLIKRAVFNLQRRSEIRGGYFNFQSIFKGAFLGNYVGLGVDDGWPYIQLDSRVNKSFLLNVQFEQKFFARRRNGVEKHDVSYSNLLTLEYINKETSDIGDKLELIRKQEMWSQMNQRFMKTKKGSGGQSSDLSK